MIALQPDKAYHFLLVNCNDYKNGVSVILSSQCIKALANNFKQAKISLLLHSSMKDFFLNNPHINQIFCIDTTHNLIKELKRANINISLSLVADKQSTIALFRSGIKVRIGVFSNLHSLLFNYKIKQKKAFDKHEATYNLDLLRFLQCRQFFYPKLYLKLSDITYAQDIVAKKFGLDSINEKGYIVICPSHGINDISWKARNFFEIANAIAPLHNVLLLAKENELDNYKAMLEQFPNISQHNLFLQSKHEKDEKDECSEVIQMLSLIHLSRLFIANNNTLLHCAAALDVSTFCIMPYKNSLNPYKYAPISQHKKHIVCTPFGIFNPQDSYEDSIHGLNMDSITPDIVLAILQAKFFPDERLFIQSIASIHNNDKPKQNNEAETEKKQHLTLEDSIIKDMKKEEFNKEKNSILDIQDFGFTNNTKRNIDERG